VVRETTMIGEGIYTFISQVWCKNTWFREGTLNDSKEEVLPSFGKGTWMV
jgi:hypothetical protein